MTNGTAAQRREVAGTNPTAALRATCIHEYAHLAVARRLGACGYVRIARVVSEAATDRWHGEFHLYGDLHDDELRRVALAGCVAERYAATGCRDVASHVAFLREPGRLSSEDARQAIGFTTDDVAGCIADVVSAWREIEAEADERAATVLADALMLQPG